MSDKLEVWAIVDADGDIVESFTNQILAYKLNNEAEARGLSENFPLNDLKPYTLTPGHEEVEKGCDNCANENACNGMVAHECIPNNLSSWQPREEGK